MGNDKLMIWIDGLGFYLRARWEQEIFAINKALSCINLVPL